MKQRISATIYLLLLSLSGAVYAQVTSDGTGGGNVIRLPNPLKCATDPQVVCIADKIVSGLVNIAWPIATIMILIGAFQILTAGGSPERVSTGRKTILYAVIGFAIVLVAKGITLILGEILGVNP